MVNVPRELEHNMYSAVGWSSLSLSIIPSWLMVILNSTMSLLMFCLQELPNPKGEEGRSPTIILDPSLSPCRSINFCLMYIYTLLLGAYTLRIAMSSWRLTLLHQYVTPLFKPENFSMLWSQLCNKHCTPGFFFLICFNMYYSTLLLLIHICLYM